MAKEFKKRLEELNKEETDNDDENSLYDYDEDAPRYCWAGDNPNEIIFYDDED
jgi:hypothetical protein